MKKPTMAWTSFQHLWLINSEKCTEQKHWDSIIVGHYWQYGNTNASRNSGLIKLGTVSVAVARLNYPESFWWRPLKWFINLLKALHRSVATKNIYQNYSAKIGSLRLKTGTLWASDMFWESIHEPSFAFPKNPIGLKDLKIEHCFA